MMEGTVMLEQPPRPSSQHVGTAAPAVQSSNARPDLADQTKSSGSGAVWLAKI